MLESITTPATEIPIDYIDQIEVSPHEAFIPSLSWTSKSTKRKIFELCIIDKLTHQQAAIIVGYDRSTVSRYVQEILKTIDKL